MSSRTLTILMTFAAVALVLSTMGEATPVYIWNASKSVPVGLYQLQPIDRFAVTDLVAVRPPEPLATFLDLNGYLPIGVPMLKRVLALPGQTVCRRGLRISVDGIDMGEALSRDSRGRPLPVWQGCRAVGADELFLMNWQSEDSLDGRYFGFVPNSSVIGKALPVWTRRSDRDRQSRKIGHSAVRSNAAPFLRPDQVCYGDRAQRRSRAAARPAR